MARTTKEILEALKEFTEKLENGEPIEASRIERVKTPDGPMHISKKVTLKSHLNKKDKKSGM